MCENMTGSSIHGDSPHDIWNSTLPARNSRTVCTSEIMRNGIVLPSISPERVMGAMSRRFRVPVSRSLIRLWAMKFTMKNTNITVYEGTRN